MQELINEVVYEYNLSYTVKKKIEILVSTAILKGKNESSNNNVNSFCVLCKASNRN